MRIAERDMLKGAKLDLGDGLEQLNELIAAGEIGDNGEIIDAHYHTRRAWESVVDALRAEGEE